MKDEVSRHINKLSKGNIFLCTHLVTTKIQTTGPFMHPYSLWLTFWRSDLLKCIIHRAVLRYTSRLHSTVRKTTLCELVAFQGIFFHVQRVPLYPWCIQKSYPAAPCITHSSLPFSSERNNWACGIRNTCLSLFCHSPPKNMCAHRNWSVRNSCESSFCGTMDNRKPVDISHLPLHSQCKKKEKILIKS